MYSRPYGRRAPNADRRLIWLTWMFGAAALVVVLRLGFLQIMEYGVYALLASDQHDLQTKLNPTRGQIFVRDRADGALHPLATNQLTYQVYAVPRDMEDASSTAHAVATALGLPDEDVAAKLTRNPDDPYELLAKDVPSETADALRAQNLEGIGFVKTTTRYFPERDIGGQLVGFVAPDSSGNVRGQYGIEGAFDRMLTGTSGRLVGEKDASGRRLVIGQTELKEAVNGSDVVLTVDRSIQYKACSLIRQAVQRHGADGGSIIVMDPQTGAILALCSAPDFNPAEYSKVKDLSVLNNPVTLSTYEPGSVFKPFTMAAGLDAEKISPKTTYEDKGVEEIDDFKIKNSDGKAHGIQNMTQVLEESLNTGTIFVQRQLGKELFKKYVENFGFGTKTGIELTPEAKGNVSPLGKKGSIYAATASYGQGITVSPIQLLAGYAALGNGGRLLRPYIVEEIIHPDGTRERTKPLVVRQAISRRASRLITGMLVSVVEHGHGKRAGVPGYWVAGKTGTAQVARSDGPGYLKDVSIGSFAGFAPSDDPKFAMLVKLDRPRDVEWAESSAAPLFGEMADFLLTYLQVPPDRPLGKPVPLPVITATSTSSTR